MSITIISFGHFFYSIWINQTNYHTEEIDATTAGQSGASVLSVPLPVCTRAGLCSHTHSQQQCSFRAEPTEEPDETDFRIYFKRVNKDNAYYP